MTKFYPEVKKNLSPSSASLWQTSPSGFRKVYYEGESIDSHILREGTRIHQLAEKGFVKLEQSFKEKEVKRTIDFSNDLEFRFTLDSDEDNTFVDYKTQNVTVKQPWTQAKVNKDVKQLANAWALWEYRGRKDNEIVGSIEVILVEDKDGELIPTGETKVFTKTYSLEELMDFPKILNKMVEDVNADYLQHQSQTDLFMDDSMLEQYALLKGEEARIKAELAEINNTINEQMEKGNVKSHKTTFGTFSRTMRKSYEYPAELIDAEAQVKAQKKDFEMKNEPSKVTYSLAFRKS